MSAYDSKTTTTTKVEHPVETKTVKTTAPFIPPPSTTQMNSIVNEVSKVHGYGNSVVDLVNRIAAAIGECKTDSSEIAALAARVKASAAGCAKACFANAAGSHDPYAPTTFAVENAVPETKAEKEARLAAEAEAKALAAKKP